MKISVKLFVLLTLIWFLFPQNLCSYAHFSDEEGLTQNFITSIYQDQQGFIWIGTIKGLNRYDGSKFRNYFASSDSTGLGLSVSYLIITDNHQGKLFVESEINIGTKFTIVLPLQKEENAE